MNLPSPQDIVGTVDQNMLVGYTADIVAAYVQRNPVSANDLASVITQTHAAVVAISRHTPQPEPEPPLVPAVPIKKSVTNDFIICLEDGQQFKSLKRHLRTHYNLSPDEYREKWGLPADYPMVAPSYSATRSKLAKDHGLGKKP